MNLYYRPQTKFAKVTLHLSVSHSVHREGCLHPGGLHQGGSASGGGGVCMQKGLGRPPSDSMGHGQRAGGTHPTGMHSCVVSIFLPLCSLRAVDSRLVELADTHRSEPVH